MEYRLKILVFTVLCFIVAVELTDKGLEIINNQFYAAQKHCFQKLELGQDLIQKFDNFWNLSAALTPDMGCMIRCTLQRLELLDHQDRLVEANANFMMKSSGTDLATAVELVKMFADCSKEALDADEGCPRALKMGGCIRFKIYKYLPPDSASEVPETYEDGVVLGTAHEIDSAQIE